MFRPDFRSVKSVRLSYTVFQNIPVPGTFLGLSPRKHIFPRRDQFIHKPEDASFLHPVLRQDLSRHAGILISKSQKQVFGTNIWMVHFLYDLRGIPDGVLCLFCI